MEKLLENGQIRKSRSPWASRVVLALKQGEQLRFCIDYRRLNAVTVRDSYPLPRIDDLLDLVRGAKYFSSLDLATGYWQVPLEDDDKEKTAFITKDGLFEWNVAPFGLKNMPPFFQRMMDAVLAGLKWQCCLVYLDDVAMVVFGSTFEQHVADLRAVLQALKDASLSVKLTKCAFAQPSIRWLGHIVSGEGVRTDPTRVQAVRDYPTPKTLKELQRFLGLAGAFRKFTWNFAQTALPLTNLLQEPYCQDIQAHWTEACDQAMATIKRLLSTAPVLTQPNFANDFILQTDGSGDGLGAVLLQKDKEGTTSVIAFVSRTLKRLEKQWNTTEVEALAVVWACEVLRHYLIGKRFLLETDHAALCWALKGRTHGRLGRWALLLSEYDFEVKHRPGTRNRVADALSRAFDRSSAAAVEQVQATGQVNAMNQPACAVQEHAQDDRHLVEEGKMTEDMKERWKELQREDEQIKDIVEMLEKDEFTVQDVQAAEHDPESRQHRAKARVKLPYFLDRQSGLVYFIGGKEGQPPRARLVVPTSQIGMVLRMYHDSPIASHMGRNKTYAKICERFYWHNMKRDVYAWVKTCDMCQTYKGTMQKRAGLLHPILPQGPFHTVHVDLCGPFPKSRKNNSYVLSMVCAFTGWPILTPLPDKQALTVAKALVADLFADHCFVSRIIHDQGLATSY